MLQVKGDKLREVKDGHDGTWVAHPALVKIAMDIFNEHMPKKNQIDKKREDVNVTRQDLLQVRDTVSFMSACCLCELVCVVKCSGRPDL